MRDDPDSGQTGYDCGRACAGEPVGRGALFVFAMVIDYSMIRGKEQGKSDKRKRFPFFRLNIGISGKFPLIDTVRKEDLD